MEKEKAHEEKENPLEKVMADLAADAEEEKDADAEKEEEKAEKEKESSLDKWVRKVTAEKESLVEKVKDLCATIVESQDILPQSVTRIQEKEKVKVRAFATFTVSMRIGIKGEQWNEKWQNWNNNDGQQQQQQQSQQPASSSGQPSVRMVSQVRGNESVRRVTQESTVTIEEVEDEVIDLIGMFNNFARSSNVGMVKEKSVRFQTKRLFPSDSEHGMSKKEQRETILCAATKLAELQLEYRNYPKNEIKRVKEILEYLKDYPERPGRTEFLERLDQVYTSDDRIHRELKNEDRDKCRNEDERRKQHMENKKQRKSEQASRSKENVRRVEVFDISEGDDEMMVIDELMEWYLGEDVERVRMVKDQGYERDWCEPVEVCLDSGADCHVLPLSFYSEDLGTTELPELRMMITDAPRNAIRARETRANITFELQKENGRTLEVIDSCVFGEVTQPLFAVGKLWKTGWGMEPYSSEKAFLVKGNSRIPISFHRNSTMTEVRIYRAEARPEPVVSPVRVANRVEIKEGLKECLDREKWTDGWFFLPDGRPARFDWSMKTTYDPTEEGMEFPYRTVFYGPCNGDEIMWSEIEMFSYAEEWQGFEVMEFEKVEDVVITIMERTPQEVSRYIHRKTESDKKP